MILYVSQVEFQAIFKNFFPDKKGKGEGEGEGEGGGTGNINVTFLNKINKIKRNGNGRLNIIYVSPLS